jgi:hypothetical protein
MLGKLIKHDLFQSGRIFLWLLVIGVVGGGFGALFTMGQDPGQGRIAIGLLWNLILLLGAAVLQVLGAIILMVSTNRSMFTERGYLTFALPVSSTSMLASKLISNVIFMMFNMILAGVLAFVSLFNIIRLGQALGENFLEPMLGDGTMNEVLELPTASEFIIFGSFILLELLLVLTLAMMVVLFVLTISHIRPFQSKPALWIPIFLLVSGAVSILAAIYITRLLPAINVHLNFGGALVASGGGPIFNASSGIVIIALTTGFFFLTNWMLRRKISLK